VFALRVWRVGLSLLSERLGRKEQREKGKETHEVITIVKGEGVLSLLVHGGWKRARGRKRCDLM